MGNVFGSEKTMKEIVREQKRLVQKSVRDLEREKTGMERTEAALIADIKKAAKAGQVKSCKVMAKDLVRTRKGREKFINLTASLRVMSLQMSEVASQQALTDSMRNITRAMTTMNRQFNVPELQATMREFQKQSEMMGMKQEMMEDAMDGIMDDEESEEDTERIVAGVFDELNIQLGEQLGAVPVGGGLAAKQQAKDAEVEAPIAAAQGDPELAGLEARLANLKR